MVISPTVPLLYRIVLAILSHPWKVKIEISRSVKNCVGILMGTVLNLYIDFSKNGYFHYVKPTDP